jgi:arsenate reductase
MKPTVLFLCSHNSSRSQMAEGWLRHLAGDKFTVYSAGMEPGTLNPLAVEAMKEVEVDISHHRAEGVDRYLGHIGVTYLIIVCDKAAQSCPTVWPGVVSRWAWPFEDPAAAQGSHDEKLAVFRRVRDEIRNKLESWLVEIEESPKAGSSV